MNNYIFDLIKKNKYVDLIVMIENDEIKNLNIKDENNNYLIHYIINQNKVDVFKACLEKNINLNIMDSDKRSILYIPLKYNYHEIIDMIINYSNKSIGLPLVNQIDISGLTPLHYCIMFNNIKVFTLLIDNNADLYINDNDSLNAIHYTIVYNRPDILDIIILKKFRLNVYTKYNESLLHIAIKYQNYDLFTKLHNISNDINHQETQYGQTIAHQLVITKNLPLFIKVLQNKANVNIQDYYGNTILHYIVIEKQYTFLKEILKYNIQYNMTNYNGDTVLHILLNQTIEDDTIIERLILNTDVNIQNNQGETCLMFLYNNNMIKKYKNILQQIPLNFFIKDNKNNMIKMDDTIIDISAESYYNQLIKYKNEKHDNNWEIWCANNQLDKLKGISKLTNTKDICMEQIKKLIIKDMRTLPRIHLLDLKLDNGIFVDTCYYTGFPIDILFGLLVIKQNFPEIGLVIDYPLTINKKLESYYKTIGINYMYKLEFCNIEIIWSYQKIFYPSYFDSIFLDKIKNHKYIVIPIGIEMATGAHANIIFIDTKNKTIERFEPNGGNIPIGFNYNPKLLDTILQGKFKDYLEDYTYYPPYKFIPIIGFQMLENLETNYTKRIGDPNGFCGIWCTWWIYQRMVNINININTIAYELIKYIKYDNLKFKNVVRNFSDKVTKLRDNYLSKYKLNINDWVVNNYTEDDINNLEKDIFKLL